MTKKNKPTRDTQSAGKSLLVEIGTEELPPKTLAAMAETFCDQLHHRLKEARLLVESPGPAAWYATPRRLAALIRGVRTRQPEEVMTRKGPALRAAFDSDGKPTKAALGFARSCGVGVEQLSKLESEAGVWLAFEQCQQGQGAETIVVDSVSAALKAIPIARRMRWGDGDTEFVRPVHWVVLMLGTKLIESRILSVESGRQTMGHRFHCSKALALRTAESYEKTLRDKGHVIASFAERQRLIEAQLAELAKGVDARLDLDRNLLAEVTALVEWPNALLGSFDEAFLQVPEEALIASMRDHQKYFHLRSPQGSLLPSFITVSNIDSADPRRVTAGNERVLRARLSDARYFWETDQKTALADRREKLESVLFHVKLGSIAAKSRRMEAVAAEVCRALGIDPQPSRRCASLCKADLVTEMVGEFPELQGIMGRYYSANDGESSEVSIGIEEHYRPRFAGDELPGSRVGQVVSLADKLDSLVGLFLAGEAPSGEKDPYALRRSVIGILRIIIENRLDLDFAELIAWSWRTYAEQELEGLDLSVDRREFTAGLLEFAFDRLQRYYQGKGYQLTEFKAVKASGTTRLVDFSARLDALAKFTRLKDSAALSEANKRIKNILRKSKLDARHTVDPELLSETAEQELAAAVANADRLLSPRLDQGQYDEVFLELTKLKGPIDHFFDKVLVMVDDQAIRDNRLALLNDVSKLFMRVADISLLQ